MADAGQVTEEERGKLNLPETRMNELVDVTQP